MSKPRNSFSNNSFRNQAVRNLKSTGWKAANSSARTADRAAGSLARWVVTNHSGMELSWKTQLENFTQRIKML